MERMIVSFIVNRKSPSFLSKRERECHVRGIIIIIIRESKKKKKNDEPRKRGLSASHLQRKQLEICITFDATGFPQVRRFSLCTIDCVIAFIELIEKIE